MVKSCPREPTSSDYEQRERQALPAHGALAIAIGEVEFRHGMIVSEKWSSNVEERRNEYIGLNHGRTPHDCGGILAPKFL